MLDGTLGLPGFHLRRVAWSANGFTAFDAVDEQTGKRVLVKRWDSGEAPASREYDPIWREQYVLRQIGAPVDSYSIRHRPNGSGSWAVMPWFAGIPLSAQKFAGRPPLAALRVVESVALLLDFLHAVGGVHGSLNPDSILRCEAADAVQFSDLGLAILPALPMLNTLHLLERRTALYLSPEATGRVAADIDYRSDFYSLGALFYQLLVGKPPFDYPDPLRLAHAHLARRPVPPASADERIPPAVSDIVLKLLQKTPEARYRSGAGLAADVERCRRELAATGHCASFRLCQEDVPTRLRLSTKLYGRSAARRRILREYARLKTTGSGLVMVSGYPGVGKTAVVESIRRNIVEDDGFFAIGKFQQSTSAQPFLGIVAALAHLAHQLLAMDEAQLSTWRARIIETLGRNVAVLCQLVSEMELIVGTGQPRVEMLIDEAKAEFLRTIKSFVRLFARKGAPFVLFLDDVQWMDDDSRVVLDDLLSDPDLKHFLVIIAYRGNEVAPDGPLGAMLAALPDVSKLKISLETLGPDAIVQFLMDSFACAEADVTDLAHLIQTKTGGNPFVLRRYVRSLADDGLIHYAVAERRWRWDLDGIRQRQVSDNLADFMLERLKVYPRETQETLNYMACLGGAVATNDLSLVTGFAGEECARLLVQPISDGLVLRVTSPVIAAADTYRFTHDKIEQAAYALLPAAQRRLRHAQIAKRMHEQGKGLSRSAFDLVEQIDKAFDDSTVILPRADLSAIYLRSGEQAKESTAYSAARYYLERAATFADDSFWDLHYPLISTLYRVRAEVEYQLGEFNASRSFVNIALRRCREPSERADLYTLLIVQDTLQGRYQEALDRGRYALSLLGFDLPGVNIEQALDREVQHLASVDIEGEFAKLLALEETDDPAIAKILDILMYLIPPSYFVYPELNQLIASLMTRLSIEHGISPAGTKGIGNFGPVIAKRGRFRDGYLFATLALQLADKYGYRKTRPRILYTLAGDLNHWVNHLRTTREIIDDAFAQCIEQGECDYGGYLLTLARCQNEMFLGRPIDQFKKEVATIREYVDSTQNTLGQGLAAATYMALSHLDGSTDDDSPFDVDDLREATLSTSIATHDHALVACFLHLLKAHNYAFLGDFQTVAACITEAERYRHSLSIEMTLPMLTLFASLSTLASLASDDVSEGERRERLEQVHRNLDRMRAWCDGCPDNFQHSFLMIRAGLEALDGRTLTAVNSYKEAVRAAHDNDYVQFEGLAHSLLADLWRRHEQPDYAEVHLKEARRCYEQWGATRLVRSIDARLARTAKATSIVADAGQDKRLELVNEQLDLRELFDLVKRLSGEIDIDDVKTELARVLVEVTGAQKAVVFLAEQGSYEPIVTLDIEEPSTSSGDATYPFALVNLAGRTREASVVQDGIPENSVAHDPYLLAFHPVSALCLPLVHQGTLEGLVYLENRINRMDLSERKLQYLSVLGSHAAISIRNSLLYSDLESKVEKRTQALTNLANELESRVQRQVEEIKRLEKLRRFLSPKIAELVLTSGGEELLKSHRQKVTILFCDLREFSGFTDSVEPEEAMDLLKSYHSTLGDIIRRYRATVDHLAGDGLMVFIGDPISTESPIADAIDMAVEMRSAVGALITRWSALAPRLGFGIGVTHGYATIGLVGHEERVEYSAIGRYVNLASRLCNQAQDGQILTTKRVVDGLAESRRTEFVDEIQFKGFKSPISVFNVID